MITFGSDPELFVLDSDGRIIPPIELYDKGIINIIGHYRGDDRYPIFLEYEEFLIHEDGAAFEVVLKTPYNSLLEVKKAILNAMWRFYDKYNLVLTAVPSAELPDKFMEVDDPGIKRKLFVFGCNPDLDPFLSFNPTGNEIEVEESNLERYGGGHIIFSLPEEIQEDFDNNRLAVLLAYTVYIPFLLLSPYYEREVKRSSLYGTPGKHRVNKFPLFEYRGTSNSWLLFSDSNINFLENGIREALELYKDKSINTQQLMNMFQIKIDDKTSLMDSYFSFRRMFNLI